MAHFADEANRRISLQTIALAPNETRKVLAWLGPDAINDLEVQPEVPGYFDLTPTITLPDARWYELKANKLTDRAVMAHIRRKDNGAVWDYFFVVVSQDKNVTTDWDYVLPEPTQLNIELFWEKSTLDWWPIRHYVQVARMALAKHGLLLNVKPGESPVSSHVFEYVYPGITRYLATMPDGSKWGEVPAAYFTKDKSTHVGLLDAVKKVHSVSAGALPVIIATGDNSVDFHGITGIGFPFSQTCVIITAGYADSRGVTLLHEMGHAASLKWDSEFDWKPGSSPMPHFMSYPAGTAIPKDMVLAFANSSFAYPKRR